MSEHDSPVAEGQKERLDFKKALPIFVIVLIDLLGLTVIIPLLPLYAASYGAAPWLIGVLGATYPVMQFIGAPVLGRLSDRYGRRPILLVSQLGTFIGFLVLGAAHSLLGLFLSRIIDGLSGANISTAQAAISDITTDKTRTQGLGLIGAAFGLGFVAGPIITFAALHFSGNDYRVPAFVAAGFSLLSILLTWFWLPETRQAGVTGSAPVKSPFSMQAMLQAVSHPQVGLLLVLIFAQQIAFGGFEQMLALFTLSNLGMNASANAVIFVFVGILVVLVQGGFIGPWSRRLGDRRLILIGLVLLAAGLVLTALTPAQPMPGYSRPALAQEMQAGGGGGTPGGTASHGLAVDLPDDQHNGWMGIAWILAAMIPASVGSALLHPSINSLITRRVTRDEIGGILGVSAGFLSLANALAPLLAGAIFQAFGPRAPFMLGGVMLALLFFVALRGVQTGREEGAQPALPAEPAG
jgi:DHA1 family tetracycline resistance protein-like MFS transporter